MIVKASRRLTTEILPPASPKFKPSIFDVARGRRLRCCRLCLFSPSVKVQLDAPYRSIIDADTHASAVDAARDAQALRRKFVIDTLDGVVTQADWAVRFLERGDPDIHAEGAMTRMVAFVRAATRTMNEIAAETRRLAGLKVSQ